MPNDTREPDLLPDSLVATPTTRRGFLRTASLTALSAGALAACGKTPAAEAASEAPKTAAPPPPVSPREAAEAMDAMHEKVMKAFPAKTEGKGNQIMAPRLEKGVKVFDLTASVVQWELEP